MPRQVTPPTNERRLQRVLAALERELLAASDEEVREAARDVRIDPDMKGSIAWVGIFFSMKPWRDGMFDLDEFRRQWRERLKPPEKPD